MEEPAVVNRPAPVLSGIDHVHVHVADRAQAQQWYQQSLGFSPVQAFIGWADDGGPLTLADAAGTVHLALFERPPLRHRSTVAMGTTAKGLADWKVHLTAVLGQAPAFEDHGLSLSLYFADPDGNPYEITTYEHEAARAFLAQA
jgi:catechol-2,3-dioxygenase